MRLGESIRELLEHPEPIVDAGFDEQVREDREACRLIVRYRELVQEIIDRRPRVYWDEDATRLLKETWGIRDD